MKYLIIIGLILISNSIHSQELFFERDAQLSKINGSVFEVNFKLDEVDSDSLNLVCEANNDYIGEFQIRLLNLEGKEAVKYLFVKNSIQCKNFIPVTTMKNRTYWVEITGQGIRESKLITFKSSNGLLAGKQL